MINKLISVWRGTKTPPTKTHLWLKLDGLYRFIDLEWKLLDNATYILQLIKEDLESKVGVNSPELQGTPTAPTPDENDVSNLIATTEFVYNIIQKQLKEDTIATELDINNMFTF